MLEANTQRIDDIERIQRITNDAKFCAPEHSLAVELLEETSDYRRILQLLTESGRALSGAPMSLGSCQQHHRDILWAMGLPTHRPKLMPNMLERFLQSPFLSSSSPLMDLLRSLV